MLPTTSSSAKYCQEWMPRAFRNERDVCRDAGRSWSSRSSRWRCSWRSSLRVSVLVSSAADSFSMCDQSLLAAAHEWHVVMSRVVLQSSIEDAADVHVSHDVDDRAAAIEK